MFIHVFRRSPSLSCLIFKYEISQLYLQCLHYRSTFLGSQDWNVLPPVFSSFGTFQNGLREPITKQVCLDPIFFRHDCELPKLFLIFLVNILTNASL